MGWLVEWTDEQGDHGRGQDAELPWLWSGEGGVVSFGAAMADPSALLLSVPAYIIRG
jgi:hypothetical protein